MAEQPHYNGEIDLIDYIKIIYKRWKIIAVIVFISMFFAGISSLRQSKLYKASATFFPLEGGEYSSLQTESFSSKRQIGIRDLIISIFESRTMAGRIVEQLNLKDTWKIKSASGAQRALGGITKINLQKNGIIELSVITNSPQLSAKIANAYVDNLDYFNQKFSLGAQREIVQVIDRAVVPDKRMPRDTKKKVQKAGMFSFVLAVVLIFFLEFIRGGNIIKRLKEK